MLKQRHTDSMVAIFVLVIIAMLLVPLPTPLLDFLLAFNIGFSLLLLLVGLYMTNVTGLLAFPSLLLLTTLFRLGLNVASTRLILSEGQAGRVIEAFGNFLIRGEIVVGIIIFAIITIVNFIVIAKGSARVSEVAARFILESIPGKQMAIDSDLRSNLINAQTAQKRREDLRKESQLYGSMDGAMKFVQGDAIAGFFIIFTNLIGGIYLGIKNGLSFSDAIASYSILTVGDGLVSQIPALMISICAGIVVTRVSSEDGSTLGSDLFKQIFKNPLILIIASIIVFILALLPNIPATPFVVVSILLFSLSRWITKQQVSDSEISFSLDQNLNILKGKFKIELDENLLFPLFSNKVSGFYKIYTKEVKSFSDQSGLLVDYPSIESAKINPGSFRINLKNLVYEETIPENASLIYISSQAALEIGITPLKIVYFNNFMPAVWVSNNELIANLAKNEVFDCVSPLVYIIHRFFEAVQNNPEQIMEMTFVNNRIKDLNQVDQSLVAEARLSDFFTGSRVTDILHELIRQRVSIKDFKGLIEILARYASKFRSTLIAQDEFDRVDVVNFIKQQIKFEQKKSSISGVVLSPELENLFVKAKLESNTGVIILNQEIRNKLEKNLDFLLQSLWLKGNNNYYLLCSSDYKHKVLAFLNSINISISVIGLEELYTSTKIEIIGRWELD